MEIHESNKKGICQLSLSGDLTIYEVAEIKPRLVQAVVADREVEIRLADVSEIDTAGFQLLLMAKRHANLLGKPLRLVDHSPAVVEIMELFEMAGFFGDPVFIQSQVP